MLRQISSSARVIFLFIFLVIIGGGLIRWGIADPATLVGCVIVSLVALWLIERG